MIAKGGLPTDAFGTLKRLKVRKSAALLGV